jgi:hypothetical protein
MSHGHAECTNCGHTWELWKSHTEIDRLRCSECHTTGDAITVAATTTQPVDPDDLSLVAELRHIEQQTELQCRANRLREDITAIGDGSVPDDLRPIDTALERLTAKLDTEEVVAAGDLEAIEAYLTEKEEDIYTRESVTQLTDLERQIEMLTDDIEQLETEKGQLKRFISHGRSLIDDA